MEIPRNMPPSARRTLICRAPSQPKIGKLIPILLRFWGFRQAWCHLSHGRRKFSSVPSLRLWRPINRKTASREYKIGPISTPQWKVFAIDLDKTQIVFGETWTQSRLVDSIRRCFLPRFFGWLKPGFSPKTWLHWPTRHARQPSYTFESEVRSPFELQLTCWTAFENSKSTESSKHREWLMSKSGKSTARL